MSERPVSPVDAGAPRNARRHWVRLRLIVLLIALALPYPVPAPAQTAAVDLNLVLAIDCSYSVDEKEFALQVAGMALAFRHPQIVDAIKSGPHGRIAVTVIQWSSRASQVVTVPWMQVGNDGQARTLASAIAAQIRRTADGGTSISAIIDYAVRRLAASPYQSDRNVIDIASDGTNNNGDRVDNARDRAINAGVTVNGLPILNEVAWLSHYFNNHVIGGPGAFIVDASDYAGYAEAIRLKLLKEILGPRIS